MTALETQRAVRRKRRLELSLQRTMPKFQIDGTALAVSVLAAAFGFTLLTSNFAWVASIVGLVLAIVLLAFDREGYRSVLESLGFSAAVALCLALASAIPLLKFAQQSLDEISQQWIPLTWIGLTILLWVLDRTRMSGRVQYGTLPQGAPSFSFTPSQAPIPPAAFPATPSSPAPTPARTIVPQAQPVALPSPVSQVPVSQAPGSQPPLTATFTRPSFGETLDEPAEEPENQQFPASASVPEPSVAFPPAPPPPPPPPLAAPPQAASIPAGKETTIYVMLVGEGLNVLRAVRAEHLGRDYYKIVEDMPEGETWQFGPGQVVRCKKKNLSSGKAMVATEEAPRAR